MKALLIIASNVVAITCTIPYIVDVIHKKTKPRLVTWFTWSLLSIITSAASFADHQVAAGVLSAVSAAGCGSIFVLGLWYEGERGVDRFDIICQLVALTGLGLWFLLDAPAAAILIAIGVDLVASVPTIRHAWRMPKEETAVTYSLGALASLLTMLAAEHVRLTALGVPVYNFGINLFILLLLTIGSRRIRREKESGYDAGSVTFES